MGNKTELKIIEKKAAEDVFLPLRETAKNLVFGKGNPDAKILFVGKRQVEMKMSKDYLLWGRQEKI